VSSLIKDNDILHVGECKSVFFMASISPNEFWTACIALTARFTPWVCLIALGLGFNEHLEMTVILGEVNSINWVINKLVDDLCVVSAFSLYL
jgi:hypothetical protein